MAELLTPEIEVDISLSPFLLGRTNTRCGVADVGIDKWLLYHLQSVYSRWPSVLFTPVKEASYKTVRSTATTG